MGVDLHQVDRGCGPGPTLVFLHYFAGSSRAWRPVMTRLEGECRCIAPDLRGFGDSAAPAHDYAVGDYASDVVGLIERLGLRRYVLVGHSMGGKIALAVAARQPAGLLSLVLVAPSPPTPEPIAAADRAHLLATHGNPDVARETVAKVTARPLEPAIIEQVVEDSLRSSLRAWTAWLSWGSREDITEQMPRVSVPALVIAGARDPNLGVDLLEREVAGRLADARLTIVPGAGHLVPLEAPAATARLIRSATTATSAAGFDTSVGED